MVGADSITEKPKGDGIGQSVTLSQLISEFHEIDVKLRSAIESDDTANIAKFDKLVSRAWNRVVDFIPESKQEIADYAEFLINHLLQGLPESDTNQYIGRKLNELISSVVAS